MAAGNRKPQVLKGFRDFLPDQMILRQEIVGRVRGVFERHGFEPLETPALEYLEVLTGKAGENEKLMYRFEDQGGREVGLRYDLTVPLARVVAMHQNELALPFKRYQIAPVWRGENTQRGRFREFWQCDADIVGSASMLADAEVVATMAEALTAVGLPNFTIRISHRKLLEGLGRAAGIGDERATTLYRAIDKLDKIGPAGVGHELTDSGIAAGAVDRILALVTAEGEPATLLNELGRELADAPGAQEAIDELKELFNFLSYFEGLEDHSHVAPLKRYRLDLALARGLDYYTGPVYEATVTAPKVGSVAGAGRYDGLVGTFLGRPIPATGISIGLERIIEVVREHNLLPMPATTAEVLVAVLPETVGAGARIAAELRKAELNVDLSLQPTRRVGEQLKRAARKKIPLAVVIREADLNEGRASLEDLRSGERTTHAIDRLAAVILHKLGRTRDAVLGEL